EGPCPIQAGGRVFRALFEEPCEMRAGPLIGFAGRVELAKLAANVPDALRSLRGSPNEVQIVTFLFEKLVIVRGDFLEQSAADTVELRFALKLCRGPGKVSHDLYCLLKADFRALLGTDSTSPRPGKSYERDHYRESK